MAISGILNMALAPRPMVDKAPDFVLKDVDGNEVSSSMFQNKILLLNFWATWCPPCQAEIPHLASLYKEYQSKGLEVVGISLDEEGSEVVKTFVERKGIPYKILIGNDGIANSFGGIRGIPTTFLIGRDGRIIRRYLGEQEKRVFEQDIKKLIS